MAELAIFQNILRNLCFVIPASALDVSAMYYFKMINWRYVDAAALILGAVGFITPSFNAAKMGYEIEAEIQRGWTRGELSGLEIAIETMLANCRPSIRSEYSPPDFELLVEESKRVCAWAEQLSDFITSLSQEDYREVPEEFFTSFPDVREVPVGYHKDRFFSILHDWNQHVRERKAVEEKAIQGVPRELVLFSPYLLAIAFSLALTGVIFKPDR